MPKNHVFISYAHIDNLPLSPEQQGWISRFHQTFSVFLSQRMGGQAQIWRDQKLQGNDIFSDEIVNQFSETALFISIISPRYVRSGWCKKEITEFCNYAKGHGGLIVDNKSRVFKVVKTPVNREGGEEDDLPAVVRDSLGYEFYVQDDQGPMELDPDFGDSFKQDYLRKVCILANNASQLLQRFASVSTPEDPQPPGSINPTTTARKTVVFLASCSYDQRDQRELIEADLRSHGYRVLPEERLPSDDEEDHRQCLAPLLDQSHLAIHLIGSNYGAVPDGPSHLSVVEIQNSIAAERSSGTGLKRLIWLPEGLSSDKPDQVRFLNALINDAQPQLGADLLRGSVQEFRTVLHATLDTMENPKPAITIEDPEPRDPQDPPASGAPMFYLICVQQDRKQTMPLRKWFKSQGYVVSLPAFDGDATALRETNEGLLHDCVAAMIFYGAGEEAWYRSVGMDLRRAPVYRDGRPLPPPLTYLAAPSSDDKDDMVDMEEPNLVDGREVFSAEPLLSFLQGITGSTP
jgi:hypothetical protein